MIIDIAILLSRQIDRYAADRIPTYDKEILTKVISEGTDHLGRMINYYPFEEKKEYEDDWCGWHTDHGSLTALTPAMYVDENGK